MSPTCETCRFWGRTSGNPALGECMRYPPTIAPDRVLHHAAREGRQLPADVGMFPVILASAWCGEHQPRTTETAQT